MVEWLRRQTQVLIWETRRGFESLSTHFLLVEEIVLTSHSDCTSSSLVADNQPANVGIVVSALTATKHHERREEGAQVLPV
mgnify:CR=1 FL=1